MGVLPRIENGFLVVTVERRIPLRCISSVKEHGGDVRIVTDSGIVKPLEDWWEFAENENISRFVKVCNAQKQMELFQ